MGRTVTPLFRQALDETIQLWCNVGEALGTPEKQIFAPRYVPKEEDIKEAIQTDRYYVARKFDVARMGATNGISGRLDGRRGRLIGNAVAVPIAQWFADAIHAVEAGVLFDDGSSAK